MKRRRQARPPSGLSRRLPEVERLFDVAFERLEALWRIYEWQGRLGPNQQAELERMAIPPARTTPDGNPLSRKDSGTQST